MVGLRRFAKKRQAFQQAKTVGCCSGIARPSLVEHQLADVEVKSLATLLPPATRQLWATLRNHVRRRSRGRSRQSRYQRRSHSYGAIISQTAKLISGGPWVLRHRWIRSAVRSSAWLYPPLPRRWIAAAEHDRKDHDHLAFDTVVDDIREAADAEGSYSISIDAHPLGISLNPGERLGALDTKSEPSPADLSSYHLRPASRSATTSGRYRSTNFIDYPAGDREPRPT